MPSENELFRTFLERAHAAGWEFQVTETSANVYLLQGSDQAGRTVRRQGYDVPALLASCEADMAATARGEDIE